MDLIKKMFANLRSGRITDEKEARLTNFSMAEKDFLNSSYVDSTQKLVRSRKACWDMAQFSGLPQHDLPPGSHPSSLQNHMEKTT